jgi:diguanylate cyclase (GGDEF)-like protein
MRGIAAHPVMPGEGMSGRAWRSGAPEWTRDLVATATGSRRAAVEALGQRAAVAVPVKAGDEVLAVLTFTSDADLHSDAAMTQLLSSLSGLLAMFIDRLRRSEQLAVMEDAALTDSLTGLANRRHWDVRLARELLSADLGAGRLCVALIDLDAFKALNDRDGHAAGDRLLRACAAAWTQRVRDSDLLVRFGGDEFALVCPGVTLAAAFEIAERMRAATPGRQRCSIGVAAWDGAESAEALVQRADSALYAAKQRGRDCTVAA